ncbi:hypothetical protein PBAL39_12990 [Pedobacter sp. BAL39]|uniref:papain-like cysteine protease family protein n=1 Tax=Pedobacter sp. BAL39 TaxID=391596 RepID=UPI000155944C|nr:papain-like cysteine protease family protein [Pedobacter sp. BAL39]EDM35386.1 hypothetical protein PBAL39_12990 [Pedobacter sp. BAL39]
MKLNSSLQSSNAAALKGGQPDSLVGFPIQQQRMSNWCWAAVTSSVCEFYNGPVLTQRQIVAQVKNKPICATSPPIPFCNDTADIGQAFNHVGHLHQNFNGPLSPADVIHFLSNHHLIGCQLYMPSLGGGHAVLIYDAYSDSQGNLFLRVADPADAMLLSISHQKFLQNYRGVGGQWRRSYTTQ